MLKTIKKLFGWREFQEIDPQELQNRLASGETFIILDVRSKDEYDFHGHIAQARLMPLDTLPTDCQQLSTEMPLVCVDRSGRRSQMACEQLIEHGFSEVINLTGGMKAWKKAGLPIER